jgi:hypothetical protein
VEEGEIFCATGEKILINVYHMGEWERKMAKKYCDERKIL